MKKSSFSKHSGLIKKKQSNIKLIVRKVEYNTSFSKCRKILPKYNISWEKQREWNYTFHKLVFKKYAKFLLIFLNSNFRRVWRISIFPFEGNFLREPPAKKTSKCLRIAQPSLSLIPVCLTTSSSDIEDIILLSENDERFVDCTQLF